MIINRSYFDQEMTDDYHTIPADRQCRGQRSGNEVWKERKNEENLSFAGCVSVLFISYFKLNINNPIIVLSSENALLKNQ
jgi:hypothetical protein